MLAQTAFTLEAPECGRFASLEADSSIVFSPPNRWFEMLNRQLVAMLHDEFNRETIYSIRELS